MFYQLNFQTPTPNLTIICAGSNLFNYGAILSGLTNVAFAFVPLLPSGPLFLTVSLVIRCVTAVGEAAVFTAVYPLASARASPGWRIL